jgi:hypothetical protein
MQPHLTDKNPIYFRFWLAEPNEGPAALKRLLAQEKEQATGYAEQMRVMAFLDVDFDGPRASLVYDLGLTPRAVCVDVNLANVESSFATIDGAWAAIAPHVQNHVRLGFGKFGPAEYRDMKRMTVYSKGVPYSLCAEWILFKNICRRAGRFSWFHRLTDKVRGG